jgi:hypothetical protein
MKSLQYVRLSWLSLPLLFLAVHAQAAEIIDPGVSSNLGINNGSVRLDGQLFMDETDPGAFCHELPVDGCVVLGWTVNVFAGSDDPAPNECLRLDITSPVQNINTSTSLVLAVIDPFGRVYRSFGRSANDFRPLVKIDDIHETGWYTVVVQRAFDETGPARFTLRYGRYNAGNPNCANPTQDLISR